MTRLARIRQALCKTLNVLRVLSLAILTSLVLSGCDGGIFGTGDGTDSDLGPIDSSVSTTEPPTNPLAPAGETPESGNGSDSPESEAEAEEAAETQDSAATLSFSNTQSAGLDQSILQLPALKVINLLNQPIVASTTTGNSINVSAQSSSTYLTANTGQNRIDFSTLDSGIAVAAIDPLNASDDSITTVLITPSPFSTEPQDANVSALNTQAAAAAPGMAQVRLVLATRPDPAIEQAPFTLRSDGAESAGADIVFTDFFNNEQPLENYSLANAGTYQLVPDDASFAPQPIELLPDQVYTLVITGNAQLPVFIELDSRLE